jgi:hypothetical protein
MSEAVATEATARGEVWRRAGVTALVLLATRALSWIPLPFTAPYAGRRALGHLVSVRELGLTAVIEAFILVELVALLVPRLRRRRHGATAERAGLTRAAWILGLALAGGHAFGVVQFLYRTPAPFGGGVLEGSPLQRAVAGITLVASTAVLCALAGVVSRHGLGNGLAVVAAADMGAQLLTALPRAVAQGGPHLLPLIVGAAAVALVVRALLARGGTTPVPIPTCGLAVPVLASTLWMLPTALLPFWPAGLEPVQELSRTYATQGPVVVSLALALLLARLFTAGHRVEAAWRAAGPAAPTELADLRGATRTAHRSSLLLVAAVCAVPFVIRALGTQEVTLGPGTVYALGLVAAVILDLFAEARARHGPLVPAFPFQRVYAVEPALVALAAAGIPAVARARHLRAVEQFFAPYAPVEVLVPPARAQEAAAICAPIAWPEGVVTDPEHGDSSRVGA